MTAADETHLDHVEAAREAYGERFAALVELSMAGVPSGSTEMDRATAVVDSAFDRLRTAILSSDPDVAELVEALQPFADVRDCYCEDFWKGYGRKHGPNCIVDDMEDEIAAARDLLARIEARRHEVGGR